MSQLVTGALIGVISAVFGAFIGQMLHVLYDWYKESRRTRKEGLRNHFKQLELNVIKPLVKFIKPIYSIDGVFQVRSGELNYNKSFSSQIDFEQPPYSIFIMHFPNESASVMKQLSEIDKHNERYEQFINDIKKSVEEKTQIDIKDTAKIPCIYPNILDCLRQTLYQLAEAKLAGKKIDYLYCDFRKAEVLYLEGIQQWVLIKSKQSATFGRFSSREEADLTKSTLIELQESNSYADKMCDFYNEVKRLENNKNEFLSTLDFICQQYGELGQVLNKQKNCPYCKVIFNMKK